MTKSKNSISRESCKKDLLRLVKADLISELILLSVMLLIFIPLTFLGIYLLKSTLLFGIITVLICIAPPIIFIYKLIRNIIRLQLVKKNKFSIVKDTVSRLSLTMVKFLSFFAIQHNIAQHFGKRKKADAYASAFKNNHVEIS